MTDCLAILKFRSSGFFRPPHLPSAPVQMRFAHGCHRQDRHTRPAQQRCLECSLPASQPRWWSSSPANVPRDLRTSHSASCCQSQDRRTGGYCITKLPTCFLLTGFAHDQRQRIAVCGEELPSDAARNCRCRIALRAHHGTFFRVSQTTRRSVSTDRVRFARQGRRNICGLATRCPAVQVQHV